SELAPGSIDVLLTDIGNAAADNVEVPAWDEPDPGRYAAAMQNLCAYRDSGGALVGSHVSATAWLDEPEWAHFLRGRWVRGQTMLPPLGPASIEVIGPDHPVTSGVASFETEDVKYTHLHVHDGVRVLAQHTYEREPQPLVWAHQTPAGGRVVYTALGHDEGAYEAPEVLRIIRNGVDWVTAAREQLAHRPRLDAELGPRTPGDEADQGRPHLHPVDRPIRIGDPVGEEP